MATFQTILVPTDYSENAAAALTTAAQLAEEMGARITVLHVMPESALRTAVKEGWLTKDDDDETVQQKVHAYHDRMLDEYLAPLGDRAASVERIVIQGDPPREIVRTANERDFGLVVMGRRGRTLADVVLGSAAERVVRHANCPVMIVKRRNG
jgi:nucleotide-binding universal stress UspA family protein